MLKNRKTTIRRLERYHKDPVYKLKLNIRSSIRRAFKKISSSGKPCPTQEILGTNYNTDNNFIENKNYCEFRGHGTGCHPSEIGHQRIAEYIIDTIGTLQ